ncbi:hypothetical protein [Limnohabitans sp. INBF002]|uniref:hypothetical protein n=1 Tax=Limnohabitans sp. INBF002 TaxID=2986280 RepID=UPI00237741A2|nr:hypothetical protein [Limnohabitans sp. INBF002]BDU53387.1 hypothetical protein LINBF2_16220 [Limnohabitans sp. INBF002]
MGNYLVMKCACCENKFSQIEVLRLSSSRRDEIAKGLASKLHVIGARGTAQIVQINEMIVGAIYDYADQNEITRSDEICEAIESVFQDLNENLERVCEPILIDVQ